MMLVHFYFCFLPSLTRFVDSQPETVKILILHPLTHPSTPQSPSQSSRTHFPSSGGLAYEHKRRRKMGGGGSKHTSGASPAKLSDAVLADAQKTGSLDVVGFKLTDRLPEAACVTGVGNIREVLAGFNFFTKLPPNLAVFKNLETLRLEGNVLVDLSDITQILGGMTGLVELGLNGNALERLPPEFHVAVSRLEKLEIANNKLKS